jgi:hypothetical protein
MSDLLGPAEARQPERKSASHGEAGYARRPLDAYFTEPWVTRALIAAVDFHLPDHPEAVVWEPACGDGRMAKPLRDAGYRICASDIADWGYGRHSVDFLAASSELLAGCARPAAIITNPPFDQAVLFIGRALQLTKPLLGKVAILQRHEFDAPAKNHPLFTPPFAAKLVLHKRPRWSDEDKASPRFPYAWYLWDWRHQAPPILRFLPDPDKPARASGVLL